MKQRKLNKMEETVTISLKTYEDMKSEIDCHKEFSEYFEGKYYKLVESIKIDNPIVVTKTGTNGSMKTEIHATDEYVAAQRGFITVLEKNEKHYREAYYKLSNRKWWQKK